MLILAVLAILLLLCLSGCATKSVKSIDVLCVGPDGKVFHAHGAGAEVAGFTDNEWDMRGCDVTVSEEKGSKKG